MHHVSLLMNFISSDTSPLYDKLRYMDNAESREFHGLQIEQDDCQTRQKAVPVGLTVSKYLTCRENGFFFRR